MRRRHGGGLLVMGGEDPGGSMLFLRRGKGTTRHSLRLRQGKGKALHGPPAVAAQHPAQVMRTSPRPQRARLLLLLPLPPDASIV